MGVKLDGRTVLFQSTRPARGATERLPGDLFQLEQISIHAPREGRDGKPTLKIYDLVISIHAPREGRDCHSFLLLLAQIIISIHAPREGRDWFLDCGDEGDNRFQSTRPARGATNSK